MTRIDGDSAEDQATLRTGRPRSAPSRGDSDDSDKMKDGPTRIGAFFVWLGSKISRLRIRSHGGRADPDQRGPV